MSDPGSGRKPSALRSVLLLVGFACVFLAAGWSAYWYIAQNMALRELHVQLDREARRGRIWSCDAIQSGGYPLSISIDCLAPRLRIEDDEPKSFMAKRAVIRAQLYAPTLVEIDLSGPASAKIEDEVSTFDWATLHIDLRGLPMRFDRLSVVGNNLAISVSGASPTKIETLHLHLKRTAPVAQAPFGLTLGLAGLEPPALTRFAGPGEPVLLTLLGTITQVDAAGVGHLSDRLEAWRAAGGRLAVTALNLARGDVSLQGDGLVGLDQRHRVEGKLGLRLRNAGPALLALAEAAGKLQRNSLSGQLAAGILARPGELKFDVSAENGSLSVGPLRRLLALPPLY